MILCLVDWRDQGLEDSLVIPLCKIYKLLKIHNIYDLLIFLNTVHDFKYCLMGLNMSYENQNYF